MDLSRREECDWLRALIWPDHLGRFAKLDQALEIASKETLPIRVGDARALLPEALSEPPGWEPVCVYHSFATYQFSQRKRAALDDLLNMASLRTPVWRLAFEGALSGEASLDPP